MLLRTSPQTFEERPEIEVEKSVVFKFKWLFSRRLINMLPRLKGDLFFGRINESVVFLLAGYRLSSCLLAYIQPL